MNERDIDDDRLNGSGLYCRIIALNFTSLRATTSLVMFVILNLFINQKKNIFSITKFSSSHKEIN